MAFTLPDLPYAFDALEPIIDAQTMQIHHDKHHNAYVTNLNKAINGLSDYESMTIEQLVYNIEKIPHDIQTAIRNNGGGHCNHSLFWSVMAPSGSGGGDEPTGELADAINTACGSFAEFKEQFTKAAMTRFGSGWAWLGVKNDSALCVTSTPNQDNPLMHGMVDVHCKPILGLDVWEHAYYLNYQNRRPDYIAAWWKVVNWSAVADRFAAAK
ncbi:MAG: superoxide dismutase [Planctomycetes bacterium]|nr:superoxide dismutase [Planctomycetota bacterium]